LDDENDEDVKGMLPPLKKGQGLDLDEMAATEKFTRPAARYTEASLVRKLEELGIGRPSTYAPTISTIQKRNYVEKGTKEGVLRKFRVITLREKNIVPQVKEETVGAEKAKLFPTDIGVLVNEFLVEHFTEVLDYNFTANIEKQFDQIALGGVEWPSMIDKFYKPFHSTVSATMETAARVTGQRELGKDPKSGKPVYARMGKYGPMVQIGSVEDEEKPKFAKLRPHQHIQTVTFEEAMELFRLPRKLGEYANDEVVVSDGRFGPYIKNNGKFCSLKKEDDPLTIKLDYAIELIEAKKEADAKKNINSFDDGKVEVLNGRYGPYIKANKTNYKIPKDTEPKELTLEDCLEIIKNTPKKKGRRKK
jgi:DNA topoisomerase-1